MKPQPRIVRRQPMARREPARLWEHVAAIGFGIAALMFVAAVAR